MDLYTYLCYVLNVQPEANTTSEGVFIQVLLVIELPIYSARVIEVDLSQIDQLAPATLSNKLANRNYEDVQNNCFFFNQIL